MHEHKEHTHSAEPLAADGGGAAAETEGVEKAKVEEDDDAAPEEAEAGLGRGSSQTTHFCAESGLLHEHSEHVQSAAALAAFWDDDVEAADGLKTKAPVLDAGGAAGTVKVADPEEAVRLKWYVGTAVLLNTAFLTASDGRALPIVCTAGSVKV